MPQLRLPTLLDANQSFESDEVLDNLARWAVTVIKLPLNSPGSLSFVLKDKIDTAISTPLPWIFLPQPDFIYLGCPLGIVLQKPFYEMLKLPSSLCCVGMKGCQKVCEGRHDESGKQAHSGFDDITPNSALIKNHLVVKHCAIGF
jgi:hypothetical protein